jgi:hypothetical protein
MRVLCCDCDCFSMRGELVERGCVVMMTSHFEYVYVDCCQHTSQYFYSPDGILRWRMSIAVYYCWDATTYAACLVVIFSRLSPFVTCRSTAPREPHTWEKANRSKRNPDEMVACTMHSSLVLTLSMKKRFLQSQENGMKLHWWGLR